MSVTHIPTPGKEIYVVYFFVRKNGSVAMITNYALFVAASVAAAKAVENTVADFCGNGVEIKPADEIQTAGLIFLQKPNRTYYGPRRGVWLAFRTREAAQRFAEENNLKVRLVTAL
jgi:hypothetical protein